VSMHTKEYNKKYYQEHKEQLKEYYQEHKEQIKEYNKKWRQEHKKQMKELQQKWYQEHKEQIREYGKKWKQEHNERMKETNKKYYDKNKLQIAERAKKWYQKNKEKRKENYLTKLYDLTLEDKKKMLVEQDYKCAICGEPLDLETAVIDHDHKDGKVRGLLCNSCNFKEGQYNFFKEHPEYVEKLEEYYKVSE